MASGNDSQIQLGGSTHHPASETTQHPIPSWRHQSQEGMVVKVREHQHGSGLNLIFQYSHHFLHLKWQLH